MRKVEYFRSLRRGLLPFLVVWSVVLLLVAAEPDLSTAVVIGLLGTIVVFAAGARIGHFVFVGLLLAPVAGNQLAVEFRLDRIQAFLNPAADPMGAGYQVRQSLVALGSGGVSGVGIGEGRQKFGFLPEAHNDFIFAMIGEEWGLIGVSLLVLLYVAIVMVGFRIAGRAPDLFGELLAIGMSSLIAVQAILHMAVGLRLAPTTGLALPLVSYGRSNLVVTLVALGILMSVSALEYGGLLHAVSESLANAFSNHRVIVVLIGIISAIVDNVPLVAAAQGMYSLDLYHPDHDFWTLLAFCAGTGGSILIIGSAAGVAAMGKEKIDFMWYIKNISWIAMMGYFAGIAVYLIQHSLLS